MSLCTFSTKEFNIKGWHCFRSAPSAYAIQIISAIVLGICGTLAVVFLKWESPLLSHNARLPHNPLDVRFPSEHFRLKILIIHSLENGDAISLLLSCFKIIVVGQIIFFRMFYDPECTDCADLGRIINSYFFWLLVGFYLGLDFNFCQLLGFYHV